MRNWVYDVARRLGVRTVVVQRTIFELGYGPKSASTPMAREEIEAVTAKLRADFATPEAASKADTAT